MGFSAWFGGAAVSDAEVRAEIWKLGGRHMGQPLEGAIRELESPGVSTAQAQLLRACIRKMQAG